MLVAQNVALPSQRLVALPAAKVAQVPILRHGFRVLAAKNQLHQPNQMKMLRLGGGEENKKELSARHIIIQTVRECQTPPDNSL